MNLPATIAPTGDMNTDLQFANQDRSGGPDTTVNLSLAATGTTPVTPRFIVVGNHTAFHIDLVTRVAYSAPTAGNQLGLPSADPRALRSPVAIAALQAQMQAQATLNPNGDDPDALPVGGQPTAPRDVARIEIFLCDHEHSLKYTGEEANRLWAIFQALQVG